MKNFLSLFDVEIFDISEKENIVKIQIKDFEAPRLIFTIDKKTEKKHAWISKEPIREIHNFEDVKRLYFAIINKGI